MLSSAIDFAARAHLGQVRKGTDIPYIVHPLEAAAIVSTMKHDEKMLAAAVLHDTLEDCPYVTSEILRDEFGSDIAELVEAESEDKSKSWEERKAATIYRLESEQEEKKVIALGDKLSNLRSIYKDYNKMGEEVWNKFRVKDKKKIGWYYRGLGKSLSSLKKNHAYQEYDRLLDMVF